MKIAILNGGPRMAGNTMELVKAFTEGAQSGGAEVVRFDLDKMSIHGCKGCLTGFLGWKNLGSVIAGGNLRIGDIKGKTEIEEARRLGAAVGSAA